jgi:hypothetical protein
VAPTLAVACGRQANGTACPAGSCCSNGGVCGVTEAFCSVSLGCQSDCWVCGDGVCKGASETVGETCGTCPEDCGPCVSSTLAATAAMVTSQCVDPTAYALAFDAPTAGYVLAGGAAGRGQGWVFVATAVSRFSNKGWVVRPLLLPLRTRPPRHGGGLPQFFVTCGILLVPAPVRPRCRTAALLELLRSRGVTVGLFVAGAAAAAQTEVLKAADADGHTLDSLTFSSPLLSTTLTGTQLSNDLRANEAFLRPLSCRRTNILRPPLGIVADAHMQTLLVRRGCC